MCMDRARPCSLLPCCMTSSPPQRIDLEPVDSVQITTLMDNVTDIFMPDQGPARR
jgi:hypothetical protein